MKYLSRSFLVIFFICIASSGCMHDEDSMTDEEKIAVIKVHISKLTWSDGNRYSWDSDYQAIVRYGEIAIDPLVENLRNTEADTDTRKWSARLLGDVGTFDKVFDVLISVIKDVDNIYAWWHVTEAKMGLVVLIQKQPFEDAIYYLNTADSVGKNAIVWALSYLAENTGDTRVIEPLYDIAGNTENSSDLRALAVEGLAALGDGRVEDLALDVLHSNDVINDQWLRGRIVRLLGQVGTSKSSDTLIGFIENDESQWVREDALAAYYSIEVEGALPLVRATIVNDESIWVKMESASILGEIGTEEDVVLLISFLSHPSDLVREDVVEALGELGSSTAVQPLIDVLINDLDKWVRKEAADALGEIGDEIALADLEYSKNNDSSEYVRTAASNAIEKIESN